MGTRNSRAGRPTTLVGPFLLPATSCHAHGITGARSYERHRPEETLLYRILQESVPEAHNPLESRLFSLGNTGGQGSEDDRIFAIGVFVSLA